MTIRSTLLPIVRGLRWPLAAGSCLAHGLVAANPAGGEIVAGAAAISGSGNTLTIDQASDSAIINWQQFSIGTGDYVQFNQPSASAAVLNRVVGGLPSEILGQLNANGRVFLVNPQGVMFGAGSRVDVGALVASTLDIADADFQAGRYVFAGPAAPSGAVSNAGNIRAADGGFVALIGERVQNDGLVSAQLGSVVLASGAALTLALDPAGLVSVAIDRGALAAAAGIANTGSIEADGGVVLLRASAARELLGQAINNQGRISARSIGERDGAIVLSAEGGDILHAGTLDASGLAGADGGSIRVESDRDITLAAGSRLLAAGDGALAQGGSIRAVAGEHLEFESGAAIDARGPVLGGRVELSGRGSLRLRGELQLGAGGRLSLDPADFVIGNGDAATGCDADLCEVQLENLLAAGTSVDIIASNSITLRDLTDNALDGRAGGSGGALFLGIGSGSSAGAFSRGVVGSIGFDDSLDAIRIDGRFDAIAGSSYGTAILGTVESREGIRVDAADGIAFVSLRNAPGGLSPFIRLESGYGNIVGGDLVATDGVVVLAPGQFGLGGYIDIGQVLAAGDVSLQAQQALAVGSIRSGSAALIDLLAVSLDLQAGDLAAGSVSAAAGGSLATGAIEAIRDSGAAEVRLSAGGNISVAGPITARGAIGSLSGDSSGSYAAARVVAFAGSSIDVAGGVSLAGTINEYDAGDYSTVRAAYARFGTSSGAVRIGGPVSLDGSIGNARIGNGAWAMGAQLQLLPHNAGATVLGDVTVTGSIGTLAGGYGILVRGAAAYLRPNYGAVTIDGDLVATGTLGRIDASSSANVFGALVTVAAGSDAVTITGNVGVTATVTDLVTGSYSRATGALLQLGLASSSSGSSTVDVSVGGSIDVRGAILSRNLGAASQFWGTGLEITAPLGSVSAGNLSVVSGSDAGLGGPAYIQVRAGEDVTLGAITVRGARDAFGSSSGSFVYGANLFIQTSDFSQDISDVRINGPVLVSGTVGDGSANFFADPFFVRGANAEIRSGDGNVTLTQGVTVTGTIGTVSGGSSVAVLGAQLILDAQEFAITRDSGVVSVTGDIVVNGSIAGLVNANYVDVRGAELVLGDGLLTNVIDVTGNISVIGSIGNVDLATSMYSNSQPVIIGSDFFLRSYLDIHVTGAITLDGQVGNAVIGPEAFSAYVGGTSLIMATAFEGNIVIDGTLGARGDIGAVSAGDYLTVRGTDFLLNAFGNFSGARAVELNGAILLDGHVGSVSAFSFLDAAATNMFVLSNGGTRLVGDLTTLGTIDTIVAGFAPVLTGVRLYVNSFAGDTAIIGSIFSTGVVGAIQAGDYVSVYGASLYLNADSTLGDAGILVDGDVTASGSVGLVSGEFIVESDIVGAFVFLGSSSFDDVILNGTVTASGFVQELSPGQPDPGVDEAPLISGADVIRNPGSLDIADITLAGVFEPDGDSPLPSEVAIVTDGRVFFRSITSDNIFVYFDTDSLLEQATLTATGFVDLFTPSFGPTLSADSLTISAENILLSANLDVGALDVAASGLLFMGIADARGTTASLTAQNMVLSLLTLDFTERLTLATPGGLLFASEVAIGNPDSTATVQIDAGTSLFLDQSLVQGGSVSLSAPEYLVLFGSGIRGDSVALRAGSPAPAGVVFDDQLAFLSRPGVIYADDASVIDAGALSMTAATAILTQAQTTVGDGVAAVGDTLMIELLRSVAPNLVPDSAGPNASYAAPIVSLANLTLTGDYLAINSNFTYLQNLALPAGTLVHLQPMSNLPVFTESVTVDRAGLQEAAALGRVATRDNRLVPTLGALSGSVGTSFPSLSDFILQEGLADTTLVIGSSGYQASIQIADQLAVDVRPSATNFVFLTSAGILLSSSIQTNGEVVILAGTIFTDAGQFYTLVQQEIMDYYAVIEAGGSGLIEETEEGEDELECK